MKDSNDKTPFRCLSIKDLQVLYAVSESTAIRRMIELKEAMKKKRISIIDYCRYEGYDVDYVVNIIG